MDGVFVADVEGVGVGVDVRVGVERGSSIPDEKLKAMKPLLNQE